MVVIAMNQTMYGSTSNHQHPNRAPMFQQSQRRRSRMEFEGDQNNNNYYDDLHQFQTPMKKHKVSHSTHSNPAFSNNFTDSSHTNHENGNQNEFGDENQNNKERAFQNHAKIAQENYRKQRNANTLNSRKMNRKFRLQQKHSNAMKNKFKNPDYWSFDCSSQTKTNTNNDDQYFNNYQRAPSVDTMYDSYDSDEFMSGTEDKFNHQQNQNNNFNSNYYQNTPSFYRNRTSFIPQTCPHPTKHRSHTSYMKPSNPPQTAYNNHNNNNNNHNHRSSAPSPPPSPPSYPSPPPSPEIKENIQDIVDIDRNNENGLNMEQCEEEVIDEIKSNDIDFQEIKMQKDKERKKLIKERAEKRMEELRNEQIKQKNEDKLRHDLRERIHPQIVQLAHPVKHNPIALIKQFYPKARVNQNSSSKDILKAFKRALSNFHPDRTMNKSMDEQIRAEEIFKLLSDAKENFEKNKLHRNDYNVPSYHKQNNHYRRRSGYGWFG